MRVTYERLSDQFGLRVSSEILDRIDRCGRIVMEECPRLIDGARALLEWASTNYQLCLLTRGIKCLQMRKVQETGIEAYFMRTEVVPQKDSRVLRDLIAELGFAPAQTWVVGDSIKSDINPALEVGAKCILYLYKHAHYVWEQEYGVVAKGPFYVAKTLLGVRRILESPECHAPEREL